MAPNIFLIIGSLSSRNGSNWALPSLFWLNINGKLACVTHMTFSQEYLAVILKFYAHTYTNYSLKDIYCHLEEGKKKLKWNIFSQSNNQIYTNGFKICLKAKFCLFVCFLTIEGHTSFFLVCFCLRYLLCLCK